LRQVQQRIPVIPRVDYGIKRAQPAKLAPFQEGFGQHLFKLFRHQRIEGAEREAAAAKVYPELIAQYRQLEARLGGQPYLCGDVSVADIAVFMVLLFARRLKGPAFGDLPALSAWYARMAARPPVATVVAEIGAADRLLSPSLFD